jgi:hypothetical protein
VATVKRSWFAGFFLTVLACGGGRGPVVQEVASPSRTGDAADPALAVDHGSGDWLMTWVSGEHLWFARSRDEGVSWTEPARVTRKRGDVHPHGESSPRLVISPRRILAAVWTNSVDVPGRRWPASNIRFARSLDGGRYWSPALTLNDDTSAAPGGHIFHGAAWSGDSTLLVTWMDERGGAQPADAAEQGAHPGHHPATDAEPDATIYLATSLNGGVRWGPNRPLWGAACPCCRVSLARAPDGSVIAGWRKHFPGSVRDPVVAPVGARTAPAAPIRVAVDDWVYPGCPHTGPGISVDARGTTHIAWYVGKPRAAGVFYARSSRVGEAAFGAPLAVISAATLPTSHPRVAALPGGGAIVATDVDARGNAVLVVTGISADGVVLGHTEVTGTAGADHPEVIGLGDGSALVAWTQRRGDASAVRVARVRLER